VVRGQFTLSFFNLADQDKSLADNDEIVREMMKRKFQELGGPQALLAAREAPAPAAHAHASETREKDA
jgi:hypothetical protein